ncbi:MAG: hypothetical protein C5S44_08605 [Candidatus Methanocomedens sp.]|nr:MAG: hypothetical protein C5S44_08605 [ANME-2 cluster archaeon]
MYDLIGIALITVVVVSFSLVILALFVGRASLHRNIWLAGFFVNVLDFFYLPIKAIFQKYSDTRKLEQWMVSLKNMANKSAFKKTKHRLLLAPHCMRSLDCPAASTMYGIECVSCGKCIFSKIKTDAERYNYTLFIVAGSSYVRHIIKKESADGALLLACHYELNKVMRSLKRKNITTYGVPLLNDGCYATELDYNKLIETMEYFGK